MRLSIPSKPRRRHTATVVIPCYRYGRYLPRAVQSALAQRFVDTRVIIVDDHSPDESLEVANHLAARDSRVRVIQHTENMGHIRTYNDGLAAVETEFVTLVSADDLVAPGALDRAVAFMERYPRVGLVYGKVVTFDEELPLGRGDHRLGLWRRWESRRWIASAAEWAFNPIISPEAVLRTEVVRTVGGYNTNLPHSGDLEYWLRVAAEWEVGQIHGPAQAYYRVHGENMHLTKLAGDLVNIRQKMDAFDVLGSPHIAQRVPWAPELRDVASERLSAESANHARLSLAGGEPFIAEQYARLAFSLAVSPAYKSVADGLISDARVAGAK